ncbi:hypothetical protein D3C80_1454060 [compost metagenome]
MRLPAPLAERQLDAGHGRIVRRRPAPQRYLQQQHTAGRIAQPGQALTAANGRVSGGARKLGPIEPEQGQDGKPTQQMGGHHQRMQRQRHRPHAQRRLPNHQHQQCPREVTQTAASAPAQYEQHRNHTSQHTGEVAVYHLAARLVRLQRRIRIELGRPLHMHGLGDGQGAVTTGPIGAGQPGIRQPGIGTEHDDQHRQRDGDRCQPLLYFHTPPR